MSGILLDDRLQLLQIERNNLGGKRDLFLLLDLIVRFVRDDSDFFRNIQIDIQFFD